MAFDREYTSLAMVTLHSSVIDFKFSSSLQGSNMVKLHGDSEEEEEKQTHAYLENGILVEKKIVDQPEEATAATEDGSATSGKSKSPSKLKRAKRKWQPRNVAEYFFFDDNGQLDISEDSIRQTYSAYTTILSNAHKQLRINYEMLANAAFGTNPDASMPLSVGPMTTKDMQEYLEKELIDRLGFENEVFASGSFAMVD